MVLKKKRESDEKSFSLATHIQLSLTARNLVHSLYLTNEKIEAQKSKVACPKSHSSQQQIDTRFEVRLPDTSFLVRQYFHSAPTNFHGF